MKSTDREWDAHRYSTLTRLLGLLLRAPCFFCSAAWQPVIMRTKASADGIV